MEVFLHVDELMHAYDLDDESPASFGLRSNIHDASHNRNLHNSPL